ncbi:hypothetical protein [[Phormidium] sp. ETS-05]|nr:hypothetical protein [[Phormidium] sp. ETS-05]
MNQTPNGGYFTRGRDFSPLGQLFINDALVLDMMLSPELLN